MAAVLAMKVWFVTMAPLLWYAEILCEVQREKQPAGCAPVHPCRKRRGLSE